MKMTATTALLVALVAGGVSLHGQVIATIAGTPWVFPSSVTQALNAPLGNIDGVAVDAQGNVYAADPDNQIVVRISPGGAFAVIAGNGGAGFSGDGGPATSASLFHPSGVAVDAAGNVYIADTANQRIRMVSGGIITTVAGNGTMSFTGDGGPATSAALNDPDGVAVDSSGNLFIADTGNNWVREVSAGIIKRVAGAGGLPGGFSGDGGPATSAQLNYPSGVAVDAAGNLYIADLNNARIRKVSGGTISTVAGGGSAGGGSAAGDGGPATSASLNVPSGLALDAAGNIYIADTYNNRIRKVSGGTITTIAGNGNGVGFSGDGGSALLASFDRPMGVAVDSSGNVYVADTSNDRVRKVSGNSIATIAGNGTFRFSGDGGPATSATLFYPSGAVTDSAGNLYIADSYNNRIRKISGGNIATVAGNGIFGYSGDAGPATNASLAQPVGVALDSAGNLYIADSGNNRVRKVSGGTITTIAGNGTLGFSGDRGPATSAEITVGGVAVDSAGNVYIADSGYGHIRKVSGGTITTVAGNGMLLPGPTGDGGPATAASIGFPSAVAVDSSGNLYIADTAFSLVRKISGGIITTVAGIGMSGFSGDGGPAANAALSAPGGIAVDATGSLYIADSDNARIRKVSGGTISTVAGNGVKATSGDGGPATSASLYYPEAVALDSGGNLYIAQPFDYRVREVLATAPAYQASPATLSFSAASGAAPASQSVNLASSLSGLAFTASTSATWLTVTPSSGAMPAVLQVSVDPGTLVAGTYTGTVSVLAPNAVPASTTIGVTLTVSSSKAPILGVSAKNISFTATQGATATSQSLQILDTGGGSLSFTATVTSGGGSWLSLSAQSGTASPATPASLTVTATPGPLAPGTYNGAITIAGAGTTITVPVTLSISPASTTILVSQNALTFNAVSQGGIPLPQLFGILNTGQGAMNWTASATTLSGGNWLQLSPTSGTVQRPFLDVSTVYATVNPAGLASGMYYGRIQIASTGAVNSPQSLTVILNVLPPGTNLGPQIYPNGLIFTGFAGVDPGSQDVMVGNTAASSNSYQSSTIGPLSFLPTNAVIQPNQPAALHVYPDFTNLGAGIARGTITLQFNDGSPSQAINILMSAAPAGAGTSAAVSGETAKLEPRATSCPPQALNVVFRAPRTSQSFTATVGQSITLEAAVSDACGNQVVPGPQQPHVIALFSNGDPQSPMSYLGNGVWQTSWRPVNPSPLATVTITAEILAGATVVGGTSPTLQGAVVQPSPGGVTPLVTAQGVVHAASDAGGIPIAPGELISVYGANLASGSAGNSGLPLPLSSNGTQVFLGTQPLPILYTSSGQMNVQVPYSAPVNTTFQLSVQNGSTLSVPQTLTVAQASPGIFTSNEQGFGQGAIVKSDGVTPAQPGTPAAIGDTVVIYCTGLGATNPAVVEGQPAPSTPLLAATTNPTTVTIGGQPAQVSFSGLTPGFAGLYQVNAVVPSGIATGDAVPVTITVAGQTSQAGVTMAVH